MTHCVAKITKQSQTTDCSTFPRCYISDCSDEIGRLHARCQKRTNGFMKPGALPPPVRSKCIASQELRVEPGVLPT
jgi:hypothetical protein